MSPPTYRVYPHTPIQEVADLMVRRRLSHLPVVGERFELLGIVTVAELLGRMLAPAPAGSGDGAASAGADSSEPVEARHAMSRSVLSVSESDDLAGAARAMVARGVGQLAVVRDGELVGTLSLEAATRALFPPAEDVEAGSEKPPQSQDES